VLACAVFGCATLDSSGDYWYRRDGDSLVVGCNSSTDKWYLVCKDQRWLGDVGNCSNTHTGPSQVFSQVYQLSQMDPRDALSHAHRAVH